MLPWVKRQARELLKRAAKFVGIPLRDPALVAMFGGNIVNSGVEVDESTSLSISAYWAGVNVIAGPVATLPLVTYQRDEGGNRQPATDSPVHDILLHEPNPEMSPFDFFQTIQAHALTWGNGYAHIEWADDACTVPRYLWPIMPNQLTPDRDAAGAIIYNFEPLYPGETPETFSDRDIIHIKGLGFDGLKGYSVVHTARESLGLTLAAEQYGAGFFGNGSQPGGYITHPGELNDQARETLRDGFEKIHRGPGNSNRIAILDEGMTFNATSIPPEDAQFLATRQFQVTEIARWFNVPPHMLRDLSQATFSNIEHQGIDFLTYSLHPWLIRWAQELHRKLFPLRRDRRRYILKHYTKALLTTDTLARFNAYKIGREGGWLTLNDIMRDEDMNSIGVIGDTHLIPLNMTVLGQQQTSPPLDVNALNLVVAYISAHKPYSRPNAAALIQAALPTASPAVIAAIVDKLAVEGIVSNVQT